MVTTVVLGVPIVAFTGALRVTLKGDTIVADFLRILDDYVDKRFGGSANGGAQRHVPVGVHQADVSFPKNHA